MRIKRCYKCKRSKNLKEFNKDKSRKNGIGSRCKAGIIRGLLCINCNFAIGQCDDSPEILRNLANYLERKI